MTTVVDDTSGTLEPTGAANIVAALASRADAERRRLDRFVNYHAGRHDPPYTPSKATLEYRKLTERAITNLHPTVVDTQVERLYADGHRARSIDDNSPAWDWWQANGLDARQKGLYQTVAVNGYGYVLVLPGDTGTPMIRPASARAWYAEYDDPDDEWPRWALRVVGDRARLIDREASYWLTRTGESAWMADATRAPVRHGLGVCPLVRFVNHIDLDADHPVGEVEPFISVQDRLNQTVFDLLVAQTYAAVPQKYIAGLITADDDDTNLAVQLAKRIWTLDSKDVNVGQLPAADLNNLVVAIANTLRIYGLVSKTPPHYMLGEIVNISADALTAAEASLSMKIEDRRTILGESWEQTLRLAGVAARNHEVAEDTSSQIIWRDTDPRSLAATADALGKLKESLEIPATELWAMIPGVTQTDIERWKQVRAGGDPVAQLEAEIRRQMSGFDEDA